MLMLKDWNCRKQRGYMESRREQVRLQVELSMKEKLLRDTQIRRRSLSAKIKRKS